MFRLQRISLQHSRELFKHENFFLFPFWGRFDLPGSGSGSESGSPDPIEPDPIRIRIQSETKKAMQNVFI
jgi:hypothetical protein